MRRQPPATFGEQPPQVQLLEHTRWPHESPLAQAMVSPGVHAAVTPEQVVHSLHGPQVQVSDEQV